MTTLTQDEQLATEINQEHALIAGRGATAVEHAIKAGELLLKVKEVIPRDANWTDWMDSRLDMHRTTAFGYMRLARYQDQVRAGGFTGIDPALEALTGEKRLTAIEKEAMQAAYAGGNGKTLEELAREFGVRRSTVWYWVSAKNRARVKTVKRHERQLKARAAERAKATKLAKHVGGKTGEAYSMVRKAEQQIDRRLTTVDRGTPVSLALHEALDALYRAEDQLSLALKLEA